MTNTYYVYILTNARGNVMYVGVTNNLERRIVEHRNGSIPGFTQKYAVHKLVYYEECGNIDDAIAREKQLKGWRRAKKDALVQRVNPEWCDLASDW